MKDRSKLLQLQQRWSPVGGNQAVSVCHSGSFVLGHIALRHLGRAGLVQQVIVVHAHMLFPGPGSWK